MSGLPVVSGKEAVKAFKKLGYEEKRQTGDHVILKYPQSTHGERGRLSVPQHKELAKGTLRELIKDSGCTVDEFRDLL